jgi:hypothetical protein
VNLNKTDIEKTDAELKVFMNKLEELSNKILVLLTIPDKNIREKTLKENEDQIFGNNVYNYEFVHKTLGSFFMSNAENEQNVFEDFLAMREIEKEVIVKFMDYIVKIGIFEEVPDIEKRRTWLQKIKNA